MGAATGPQTADRASYDGGMPETVSPSLDDPVARGASSVVGGPVGAHARRTPPRWFLAPLTLLMLMTAVTFGLGYLQKKPCRDHAWTKGYQYTRLCYTDTWALYYSAGLDKGERPYVDHALEYPALVGGTMWVAAKAGGTAQRYFDVTAVLMLGCALAVTVGLMRSSGRRPWDAALFALAPTLVLHGLTNWDLLAVAAATLAIAAWARRWPAAAGVCIGLGAAAKLYPLLFFVPLVALGYRSRRLHDARRAGITAAATLVAINVPAFFMSARLLETTGGCQGFFDAERSWWQFFNLNRCRPADWDSIWYVAQNRIGALGWFGKAPGYVIGTSKVNVLSFLLFAGAMAAIVYLTVTAPRRPRLGQLLFLSVASFLLVNKVWSPQYVLWLVPLAVLARPRWRMFLVWQAAELFLTFTRYYFFLQQEGKNAAKPVDMGVEPEFFLGAVVLRDVVLIALMVLVVREIRQPQLDVVRRDGSDDPAGGVFDDAPDRYDLPLPPARPAVTTA